MSELMKLAFIQQRVPKTERLAQLAEEAAELSQAALKLRRAMDGVNPTPLSLLEAEDKLLEEYADVRLCFDAMERTPKAQKRICTIYTRKLDRWVSRLEAKE